MDFQLVHGKMRNKILITINKEEDIKILKELGINTYVYPLDGFCVGYPNTFLISKIPDNSYILVNRILDNKGIDDLKELINNNLNKIKGIIFDDLGILQIIKDLKMEKILYLSHFNTNKESINIYLDYVDSVIVSTDITKKEIEDIIKFLPDKLTLFVLGYVGAMYSRRHLLDNYAKFHNIPYQNELNITNTNHDFLVMENEYGTYFYHTPLFNGLELLELNTKYYFINSAFLSVQDIKDLLEGTSKLETDTGFLYQETIFKLKGEENND